MWKLELEDYFYKIYDSSKNIAGYFDPDYGKIHSADSEQEQIRRMHENADKIAQGFLTLPMVKFGVFDERAVRVDALQGQVKQAMERIAAWKDYVDGFPGTHSVTVSHTDPDMLSITLQVRFGEHTPLDRKIIGGKLEPILNRLQGLGLL